MQVSKIKKHVMIPPAVFAGRGHPADNPPLLPALPHPEYLSPRKKIVSKIAILITVLIWPHIIPCFKEAGCCQIPGRIPGTEKTY
jgi:hypothetical protein